VLKEKSPVKDIIGMILVETGESRSAKSEALF